MLYALLDFVIVVKMLYKILLIIHIIGYWKYAWLQENADNCFKKIKFQQENANKKEIIHYTVLARLKKITLELAWIKFGLSIYVHCIVIWDVSRNVLDQ